MGTTQSIIGQIKMGNYIPLSVPSLKGNEWQYIKECLDTNWVSSAGKYVDLFEQRVAEYTGVKHAIACVNGTSALHVSLRLAGVKPGDAVIAPTLTFIAPINAIAYNGATPIFMDADQYYNLDSEKTINFIKNETVFNDGYTYSKATGKRITAIMPVHVWGNAVWLDDLVDLCKERNISIIEDASESLGTRYTQGKYAGKHTGTVGRMGCISFNGNKIITTGGGGMILTDDDKLASHAKYLTTQAKNDDIRYIHDEIGYNFRLTNIQAALGVAQLEQLPKILHNKKEIYKHYKTGINEIKGLNISAVPEYAENNYWLNILSINKKEYPWDPILLMQKLENEKIQTRPVWHLNHLQKPYIGCESYEISHAPILVQTSLCLPSSGQLSEGEVERIIYGLAS